MIAQSALEGHSGAVRCSVAVEHPNDLDLEADRVVYVRDSGESKPGVQLQETMEGEAWTFPHHTPSHDLFKQAFERLASLHGWACAPPAPERSVIRRSFRDFAGGFTGAGDTSRTTRR